MGTLGPPGAETFLPRSSATCLVFPGVPLLRGFLPAPQPHPETPKGFFFFCAVISSESSAEGVPLEA